MYPPTIPMVTGLRSALAVVAAFHPRAQLALVVTLVVTLVLLLLQPRAQLHLLPLRVLVRESLRGVALSLT